MLNDGAGSGSGSGSGSFAPNGTPNVGTLNDGVGGAGGGAGRPSEMLVACRFFRSAPKLKGDGFVERAAPAPEAARRGRS